MDMEDRFELPPPPTEPPPITEDSSVDTRYLSLAQSRASPSASSTTLAASQATCKSLSTPTATTPSQETYECCLG